MHATTPRPARPSGRRRLAVLLAVGAVAGLAVPLVGPTSPAAAAPPIVPVTGRATLTPTSGLKPTGVDRLVLTDRSGRHVFFSTPAPLVEDDTNGTWDVYRRDQRSSRVARVSLTDADGQIGGASHLCGISPTGDAVGFWSSGTGLPAAPGVQLWLRGVTYGTTILASRSNVGTPSQAGAGSGLDTGGPCGVTDHGTQVAFASSAANLVANDGNGTSDVFRHEPLSQSTVIASVDHTGAELTGPSTWPSISADGTKVAFQSTGVLPGTTDANGASDVFVRDLAAQSTTLISATTAGAAPGGPSTRPFLADGGAAVAFESTATNLVPDDDNAARDIFVGDLQLGAVERVSVASNGVEGNGSSSFPSLSSGARYVGFSSLSTNLYVADGNGVADAFRHDRVLDATHPISRTGKLALGSGASAGGASVSDDGNVAAFSSAAEDLVRLDGNGTSDAFTRTFRLDLAPFASIDDFTDQVHRDAYGAPAAPEFLDFVRPAVQHGEVSIDQLLVGASRDEAFAGHRANVVRLYWAFFHRQPDQGGLAYWKGRLDAGKPLATAATQFAGSSEFQGTYGTVANQAFVKLIYLNIFDRDPDAAGLAFWTKKLDTEARTKGQVMLAFSESSEGLRVLQPVVDATLLPLQMLGHLSTTAAFESALATLRGGLHAGEPAEHLAHALRHTAEYAARVSS